MDRVQMFLRIIHVPAHFSTYCTIYRSIIVPGRVLRREVRDGVLGKVTWTIHTL